MYRVTGMRKKIFICSWLLRVDRIRTNYSQPISTTKGKTHFFFLLSVIALSESTSPLIPNQQKPWASANTVHSHHTQIKYSRLSWVYSGQILLQAHISYKSHTPTTSLMIGWKKVLWIMIDQIQLFQDKTVDLFVQIIYGTQMEI